MPPARMGYQPSPDPARGARATHPLLERGTPDPSALTNKAGVTPAPPGVGTVGASARQPAAGEGFRAHLIASPFGTIHAATFSFPQPVGTVVPATPASYSPAHPLSVPAVHAEEGGEAGESGWQREFPEINRGAKGPRLVPRVRPDFYSPQPSTIEGAAPSPALQSVAPEAPPATVAEKPTREPAEPTNATLAPNDALSTNLDRPVTAGAEQWLAAGDGPPLREARIYFAPAPLGGTPATLEPWESGQAPLFEPPEPPPYPPPPPLPIPPPQAGEGRVGAVPPANIAAPLAPLRNETIAPKGEVTGFEHRPKSPAERLGLVGAARARHEKCLADAIYFEARGESIRGQMAVAQVVINRVFSGYYPNNVCGVVYQNAHRRFRCQFTFACDGLPERINEPVAWERAKHIARDALDGNFWLNDVGKATHYHARWVHPWWVHEMRRLDRIGVHTFYRPRNWGDGSKSPIWGDGDATATAAKTL
jgi:spore germination cell wall hydrolase CwlJ-like protein